MNVSRLVLDEFKQEVEKLREQRTALLLRVARLTRELEQKQTHLDLAELYERPLTPDAVDDAAEDAAQLIRRVG